MCDTWDNGFLSLAESLKKEFFKNDTDTFLGWIANTTIMLDCYLRIYEVLVKRKLIVAIEDLTLDERKQLWEEAKRLSGAESKEKAIKISKAIHTLGTTLQL
jgi:hypothetical protein